MNTPDQIFIHAHIPNEDGTMYLVDDFDKRPSMQFDSSAHGTYEGTLDAIVQDVTNNRAYAKVDRRAIEHEVAANEIVYQTQRMGYNAFKSAEYTWKIDPANFSLRD